MPKLRLTDNVVQRIRPPADGKQKDYRDTNTPGLILRVNYGGAKVWRALHYLKRIDPDGKHITIPTTHKLGKYPILSLKQAREKAKVFLADPDKAMKQAEAGTFKDVAENFLKRHVDASKLRSKGEIVRCLVKYVYPHWGNRPFREIKRGDVANLLDVIEDQHGARQADIVLSIIRRLMNWYATRDGDYASCIVKGMKRANGNGGRARILGLPNGPNGKADDNEIRAFWNACEGMGQFGSYCQTLLLTGQRRTKVATMRWEDLVDGAWHIRTDDPREKDNARVLKLPKILIEILHAQPRIAGNPFVFAGNPRGRRKPGPAAFNGYSEGKKQLDAVLPLPGWTLHDLRRTARSLMSRAGVQPHVAEKVLGHSLGGIAKIYDRHDYTDEKADALERLAALLASIVNPPEGNVLAAAGSGARGRKRREA
jgi:integrase